MPGMRLSPVLLLALLSTLLGSANAEVQFSGYAKSFAVTQEGLNNTLIDSDRLFQSQSSLRLMAEGFSDRIVWQVHYELSPILNSAAAQTGVSTFSTTDGAYRYTNPKTSLLGDDQKNQLFQNLDRFNVQVQLDAGDLTIGRQAISFGSARVINPTDIFLPFDVRTLNTEYRIGVDAIRFQRPWGELGEIDVGVVLGDDADRQNSAAFLQLRANHNGVDYHLALMEYADQSLIGAGITRALGNLGFWFEIASVSGDEDYFRASTGLDYAFTGTIFGQVEYHFNGAGTDKTERYLDQLATLPYQRGGVFLLGEHYLIPALSVQASALWSLGLQAIINLSDQSGFFSFTAEYNIAENLYMDFGYYHFSGDNLNLLPGGGLDLGSEYGTNPNTAFTSIRYYF